MNRPQALASLQAYFPEDKEIVKIINSCDLNPVDGWRDWQNRYAPYIKVQKNKKLAIRWKNEDFFSPKTDLYAYSSAKDIAKISKSLLFIVDKDCFCFLFLGNDDKLRYRRYLDKTYLNDPPLFVPIEDIRTLLKNENIEGHQKIQLAKKTSGTGWITSWPPKQKFYEEVKKETQICKNTIVDSLILEFSNM